MSTPEMSASNSGEKRPPTTLVSTATVMREWRPGSYDDPWSWADEFADIKDDEQTEGLIESIRAEGIREPVELGSDGRVWGGHHRIYVAYTLGLKEIPAVIYP